MSVAMETLCGYCDEARDLMSYSDYYVFEKWFYEQLAKFERITDPREYDELKNVMTRLATVEGELYLVLTQLPPRTLTDVVRWYVTKHEIFDPKKKDPKQEGRACLIWHMVSRLSDVIEIDERKFKPLGTRPPGVSLEKTIVYDQGDVDYLMKLYRRNYKSVEGSSLLTYQIFLVYVSCIHAERKIYHTLLNMMEEDISCKEQFVYSTLNKHTRAMLVRILEYCHFHKNYTQVFDIIDMLCHNQFYDIDDDGYELDKTILEFHFGEIPDKYKKWFTPPIAKPMEKIFDLKKAKRYVSDLVETADCSAYVPLFFVMASDIGDVMLKHKVVTSYENNVKGNNIYEGILLYGSFKKDNRMMTRHWLAEMVCNYLDECKYPLTSFSTFVTLCTSSPFFSYEKISEITGGKSIDMGYFMNFMTKYHQKQDHPLFWDFMGYLFGISTKKLEDIRELLPSEEFENEEKKQLEEKTEEKQQLEEREWVKVSSEPTTNGKFPRRPRSYFFNDLSGEFEINSDFTNIYDRTPASSYEPDEIDKRNEDQFMDSIEHAQTLLDHLKSFTEAPITYYHRLLRREHLIEEDIKNIKARYKQEAMKMVEDMSLTDLDMIDTIGQKYKRSMLTCELECELFRCAKKYSVGSLIFVPSDRRRYRDFKEYQRCKEEGYDVEDLIDKYYDRISEFFRII